MDKTTRYSCVCLLLVWAVLLNVAAVLVASGVLYPSSKVAAEAHTLAAQHTTKTEAMVVSKGVEYRGMCDTSYRTWLGCNHDTRFDNSLLNNVLGTVPVDTRPCIKVSSKCPAPAEQVQCASAPLPESFKMRRLSEQLSMMSVNTSSAPQLDSSQQLSLGRRLPSFTDENRCNTQSYLVWFEVEIDGEKRCAYRYGLEDLSLIGSANNVVHDAEKATRFYDSATVGMQTSVWVLSNDADKCVVGFLDAAAADTKEQEKNTQQELGRTCLTIGLPLLSLLPFFSVAYILYSSEKKKKKKHRRLPSSDEEASVE